MDVTLDESPVASMLSVVVSALLPTRVVNKKINHDKQIVILPYRTSFPLLWNLDTEGRLVDWAINKESHRSIVIVWDGMPDNAETVNVSDFVLPFDWAFAFSMKVRNAEGNTSLPDLRIYILDLFSEHHGGAFSSKALPMLCNVAPWIQVYRPIETDRIELAALFSRDRDDYSLSLLRPAIGPGSFGIEILLDDLRNPDRVQSLREAFLEPNRSNYLATFLAAYNNNLLSAKTRHDVGNLLTPLLLVDALPKDRRAPIKRVLMQPYPLRTALWNLTEVIGLHSRSNDKGQSPSKEGIVKDAQKNGDIFGRRSFLKILLVDDQFSLGYHHLLASFLFGERYQPDCGKGDDKDWRVFINGLGELQCLSTADVLLKKLDEFGEIKNWSTPRLFDIGSNVLALDLRLWTDNKNRDKFFSRLLGLCAKLGADQIADEHFKRALRAVEGGGIGSAEQNEIEGLALFPLLLSHIDPSLPILLFSSTQQRAVAEMVSHRPNIISDFAKPIFSGYGENKSRSKTISLLERAITKGIELHESRKIWEELVTRAEKVKTNVATFEFADVMIRRSDGTKKSAQYEINEPSINELAQEFCDYVSFGRFSDSLLAIGNWSEDILGGKPDDLPARATEPSAALAAVKDLKLNYPSYETALKRVWNDSAYKTSVRWVVKNISSQITIQRKRVALNYVSNQGRNNSPLDFRVGDLDALGLSYPLPQKAEELLGRFLDEDGDAQAFLNSPSDWVTCLIKDAGSVTIAVTNGFRNARAHRHARPADSSAIRELAIWCWLWTLAGLFPTSTTPLIERGDSVNLPPLGITEFIHLKRPLVSSNITPGAKGAASLLPVLSQLKKVLELGWLKINDAGLDSALDRLIV